MAKTDGYITAGGSDDWLYSNVAGNQGGVTDPESSVSIRIEGSQLPGASVDGQGQSGDGPTVTFTDPAGLLSQVPETISTRPNILWAGVNPMSLVEVLIVWNTNITLLNRDKVRARGGGGQVVAVVGRLMIIRLESPVSIDGSDQAAIDIGAGAVGIYRESSAELPEVNPCGSDEETGGPDLGPDLGPLTTGRDQLQQLVFSTMCNPSAQCGEFRGNTEQFVVNNQLQFQARCVHTFNLVPALSKCGGSAEAWEVSMEVYGGTLPGEVLPLDQLATIQQFSVGSQNFGEGYPASLKSNVECGDTECPTADVYIFGRFGPPVEKSGEWKQEEPGYEGQAVLWDCDKVLADLVDCYVPEDIIKPIERKIPISFFEDFFVKTTVLTVPSTIISTALVIPTEIVTGELEYVPTIVVATQVVPLGEGALISDLVTTPDQKLITDIPVATESFLVGTTATALGDVDSEVYNIVTEVPTTELTIVSDVDAGIDHFVQSQENVEWLDANDPDNGRVDQVLVTEIGTLEVYSLDVTGFAAVSSIELEPFGAVLDVLNSDTVTVSNPTTEITTALSGPAEKLVVDVIYTDSVVPVDIETAELVIPVGEGAVITAINTEEVVKVDSFDAATISYLISTDGQLVSDFATGDITAASSTDENIIAFVTEAISSLSTTPIQITGVGEPVTESYDLAKGVQPGQLLKEPLETELITGVLSEPAVAPSGTYLTGTAPITVITDWEVAEVVFCSAGLVVTKELIGNVSTAVLGGNAFAPITSIELDTGKEVLANPQLTAVQLTNISPVVDVPTAVETVLQGLATTPAGTETAAIPLLTQVSADFVTFTPKDLVESEVQVLNNLVTSPVDLVTEVLTSQLATEQVTLAVNLETANLQIVSSLLLTQVTEIPITQVTEINTIGIATYPLIDWGVVKNVETTGIAVFSDVVNANAKTDVIPYLVTGINGVTPNFATALVDLTELKYTPDVAKEGLSEVDVNVVTAVGTVGIDGQEATYINGDIGSVVTDIVNDIETIDVATALVTFVEDFEIATTQLVVDLETNEVTATFNEGEIELDVIVEGDSNDITLITSTGGMGCDIQHKILMHDGPASATLIQSSSDGGCCSSGECELETVVLEDERYCETALLLRAHYVDAHDAPTRDKCPCYDCTEEECDDPDNNRLEPAPDTALGSSEPCTIRVRRLNRRWCIGRVLGGGEDEGGAA